MEHFIFPTNANEIYIPASMNSWYRSMTSEEKEILLSVFSNQKPETKLPNQKYNILFSQDPNCHLSSPYARFRPSTTLCSTQQTTTNLLLARQPDNWNLLSSVCFIPTKFDKDHFHLVSLAASPSQIVFNLTRQRWKVTESHSKTGDRVRKR